MRFYSALRLAVVLWFLTSRVVVSKPSRSYHALGGGVAMRPYISFKHLLLVYKDKAPFLYSKHRISPNVEHVVPVSVLKKYIPRGELHSAVNDPHNMFLASSAMNSKRSNYRFLFPYKINKERICSYERVGSECYISHKERLFVPRKEDCHVIAACAIHCYYKYGVPFEETVCGENMLALEWRCETDKTERDVHRVLADFYLLMWKIADSKRQ